MNEARKRMEAKRKVRMDALAVERNKENEERKGRVATILQEVTLKFPILKGAPVDAEGFGVDPKSLYEGDTVLINKHRTHLNGRLRNVGITRIPVVASATGTIVPLPSRYYLEGIWTTTAPVTTPMLEIRWVSEMGYYEEEVVVVGSGNAFYGYHASPTFPGGEISSMEEIVLDHPQNVAHALGGVLLLLEQEETLDYRFIQEASTENLTDRVCAVLSLFAQHGIALQVEVPYVRDFYTPESNDGFRSASSHRTRGNSKVWCFAPVQSTDPFGVEEGDAATFLD
mgnify:CR=1 FL=1|jgi:hypothetical protein